MKEAPSRCTERCLKCKHHTPITGVLYGEGNVACVYILDTHKRRGCPAGDKCNKFVEGKIERRMNL